MVTLEVNSAHADVARASLERTGVSSKVEVRVGNVLETLPQLHAEGIGPFDLVFIDADKQSTPEYYEQALALTRAGGLIVVDNVVRGGALADAASEDAGAQGMRRFHDALAAEERAQATTIQTVGGKGYDGFTVVLLDQ